MKNITLLVRVFVFAVYKMVLTAKEIKYKVTTVSYTFASPPEASRDVL